MEQQQTNPLLKLLEILLEASWSGWLINLAVIPILVLASILLPPISAAQRILERGYTVITVDDGGAVEDPDGTQLTILPDGMEKNVKVSLDSVPRQAFLEGSGGRSLLKAAEEIPPSLVVKSPYYRIRLKGSMPTDNIISVPIPNDAEPYETLDLYTWTGKEWEWVPSQIVEEDDLIESHLSYLPGSLAVVQTKALAPAVSADLAVDAEVPPEGKDALVEINPQGLWLDSDGNIGGNVGDLVEPDSSASYIVLPTIRNWQADGVVRSDLVDNMLVDGDTRTEHVQAIVDLVVQKMYPGVDIYYRGINPDLKAEFSDFMKELADALHQSGKLLTVRVGRPVQISETDWDTGAYDWRAIGQVVDGFKVPALADLNAYTPGGQMEALLDWAVGEVSRYKVQLLISTHSREQVEGQTVDLSYDKALEPFGQIAVQDGRDTVNPGEQVMFTLAGLQETTGINYDEASGMYWFRYVNGDGREHVVWLENAASIARKLQFVAQYNLRGVAVENLLGENNDQQIWEVIRKFNDLVVPPVQSQYAVVWTVHSAAGGQLAQEATSLTDPSYLWTAPQEPGDYTIAAAISSDGGQTTTGRGNVSVRVAEPTPTPLPPTPTPEPTATPTPEPPTPTPAPKPQPAEQPAQPAPEPAAPSEPVAGQVDTSFGYGLQVDPAGNRANAATAIHDLGFGWVKMQAPWSAFEDPQGVYHWGALDVWVNDFANAGIKVLLSVPKAPAWARGCGGSCRGEGPPQDMNTYATFMGAMAARYKGRVQAYEVWNEQNMDYEWGYEPLDPARYMQMLAAAYNAIKAADPNAIVVSGAPTPTGAPPPVAMDDLEYLRQMYAHGLKQYADAIGAHPSGYANPPDALLTGPDYDPNRGYDDHRSFFYRNTMESYHQLMVENGDGDKKIWPTEFGWPVWRYPGDARFVFAQENTLEEQAQWTVQAYQMAKNWGWVGAMFLWNLDYGVSQPNTELANFSVLTTSGPAPIYAALKSMPK